MATSLIPRLSLTEIKNYITIKGLRTTLAVQQCSSAAVQQCSSAAALSRMLPTAFLSNADGVRHGEEVLVGVVKRLNGSSRAGVILETVIRSPRWKNINSSSDVKEP